MIAIRKSIEEVCPMSWKRFVQWTAMPGNELVEEHAFNVDDLRMLAGFFIDFFLPYATLYEDIKRDLMAYSLIDPSDIQKDRLYQLFAKLEIHIREDEGYKEMTDK